jgi:hypothetical protein
MGLIQQYYNEGKIEEIYQRVQQLKQDTVKLEGEYIALREELEIEDKVLRLHTDREWNRS